MVGLLFYCGFFPKYGDVYLLLLMIAFWVKIPLYLHSNQKIELMF